MTQTVHKGNYNVNQSLVPRHGIRLYPKVSLNLGAASVDNRLMNHDTNSDAPRTFAPIISCRECASPLVQAADWQLEEDSLWFVRLWCPECGYEQAALLDRPQSAYLSLAIEEGFAEMLEALAQITADAQAPADLDLVHKAQTERIERTGR